MNAATNQIRTVAHFPKAGLEERVWSSGLAPEDQPELCDVFELEATWEEHDSNEYGVEIYGVEISVRKNGELTDEDPWGEGKNGVARSLIIDRLNERAGGAQ